MYDYNLKYCYYRYLVATQDRLLQDQLRKVPGAPIMYLHGKAPTLEPPSQSSREFAEQLRNNTIMTDVQEETIKTLMKQSGLETEDALKPKKKLSKGGPNPLSCKKRKKKDDVNSNTNGKKVNETGKVRKRKRIKLPAHVKEVLKANV